MAEQKRYRGGCHCGAVRYEMTASFDTVLSCNCSICRKRGALWTYISPADFDLLSGEDELVDYQFNQRVIHHLSAGSAVSAPSPRDEARMDRRALGSMSAASRMWMLSHCPSHFMTAGAYDRD